jgi:hypothetical protein
MQMHNYLLHSLREKKKQTQPFSMILLWMRRESWFMYFGLMQQVEKTTVILVI